MKKNKKNQGFTSILIKKHMKNNFKKNILIIFLLFISLFLIVFSYSFKCGLNNSFLNLEDTYLDSNVFYVSYVIRNKLSDSNISIIKKERPSDEEVKNLLNLNNINYSSYDSFDYFFDDAIILNDAIEIHNVVLKPHFLDNKFYGNQLLKNVVFDESSQFCLSFSKTYFYFYEEYYESYEIMFEDSIEFEISNYYEEFTYLNNPTIYYPYNLVFDLLSSNFTKVEDNEIYWIEILKDANSTNEITSYKKLILLEDITSIKKMRNLQDLTLDNYLISNDNHSLINSFKELSKILVYGIYIFDGLICIMSALLIGFLTYSSFNLQRKETAIIRILGAKEDDIINSYLYENIFIFFFSFLLSAFLYLFLKDIINNFFHNLFSISSILNLSLNGFLILFLIEILLILIGTLIPLKFSKKIDIAKELKEE